MRVVIVGAGIGGLTAALACHTVGLEVLLFEQARELSETGAGIQLGPNATRPLLALGLGAALQAAAVRPLAIHLRRWRSGFVVARRPLGDIGEARYGAPYYHLHRAELQSILLAAVRARAIPILLGHRLSELAHRPHGATLRFEHAACEADARTITHVDCDVAVGADGIHSRMRELLHAEAPARFTGNVAWRATVPTASLPSHLHAPLATVWMGPGAHLVHYLVQGGASMNLVAVVERAVARGEGWRGEHWSDVGDVRELRAHFDGWHADVGRLLEAVRECHLWALFDRPPMSRWSAAHCSLLGDACHPMSPFLAQGGAMAIEDGCALASALAQHLHDPLSALPAYERKRMPRTARVQAAARAQAGLFHLRGWTGRWTRDLMLGLGSRLLPALAQRQFDWLYGYRDPDFSGAHD